MSEFRELRRRCRRLLWSAKHNKSEARHYCEAAFAFAREAGEAERERNEALDALAELAKEGAVRGCRISRASAILEKHGRG